MKRSPKPVHQQQPAEHNTIASKAPPGLRSQIEAARLDLLALFRVLDKLGLALEVPATLHDLFELDADLAEALWALDQPPEKVSLEAMLRDTLGSLEFMNYRRSRFLVQLGPAICEQVLAEAVAMRSMIHPAEAYNQIPGHPQGRRVR